MPEIDRERLSAKLDTIPETEQEGYLQELRAAGYTWRVSQQQNKTQQFREVIGAGVKGAIAPYAVVAKAGEIGLRAGLATPPKAIPGVIGATVLGIATQGASIPYQIGAEALGAGAGEAYRQITARATGAGGPPTFGEAATDIGIEAARMAVSGGVSRLGVGIASKALVPFVTRMTPAAKSIVEIAAEKKIPLTAADITNSQVVAAFESFLQKTPLGTGPMQAFREGQMAAAMRARDELLKKFGPTRETFAIGQQLQALISEKSRAHNVVAKALYDKLYENVPRDTAVFPGTLLETTRKHIKELSSASSAFRNNELLGKLRTLESELIGFAEKRGIRYPAPSSTTLGGLLSTRSAIGEKMAVENAALQAQPAARGMRYQNTPEGRVYASLQGSIDKDLEAFSASRGVAAKEMHDVAKAFYRSGKETFNNKAIAAVTRKNPEDVVKFVFSPGNISEIRAIKQAVGEAGFAPLKQKFTERILGESGSNITPMQFNRSLARYGETLREVYSPAELSDFVRIGKVMERVSTAERLAGNPSGTARTVIYAGQFGTIFASPVKGLAVLLTPPVMAKMYLSPTGRKLLTEGFHATVGTKEAARVGSQIAAFIGLNQ